MAPTMTEFQCPHCKSTYLNKEEKDLSYCPFCGKKIKSTPTSAKAEEDESSFIEGLQPKQEEVLFSIGYYDILGIIGKGGMGEVYLAYDQICGRRIALKKIRADLNKHKQIYRRFLREARITSQLTHPGIIPIYAIHKDDEAVFYTMPFVEGITLKQLLRKARNLEKQGKKSDHIGGSIPSLIRIMTSICQAVSYAHSHKALHRDLKPENIMIGKFGEVMILDWGLVQFKQTFEQDFVEVETEQPSSNLTRLGKVVGTISYMAPERAFGSPASEQSDIYSIGVILYHMLALHAPFERSSLEEFRRLVEKEQFIDPATVAPYRDVPNMLTQICRRALEPNPKDRYQDVETMINDLENYIEGRSEWFLVTKLNVNEKKHWIFQEHVLIAESIAITRNTEISDWVALMISEASFGKTTKIETSIKIQRGGNGIGLLLSVPEEAQRKHLNEGYCLWLSSEKEKSTKLMRSNVEVVHAPEVYLEYDRWYHLKVEKIDDNIHVWLEHLLQFSYISHIPLSGTHIGVISRDAHYELKELEIYTGGQNVTVSCLAVPDAFLAHKNYTTALSEYRRIGYSFPGRAEGREALFKAGITLIEQAKNTRDSKLADTYFESALEEFAKLHVTPGAPLEYLGKALVYQTIQNFEEEIKCYTLAFRRYPQHPLLNVLEEQILYRMHETSRHQRKPAYHLIFLISRHLPHLTTSIHSKKLLSQLEKHWESLPFLLPSHESAVKNFDFSMQLSFWIAKPYFLEEILKDLLVAESKPTTSISNCLFCILELGAFSLIKKIIEQIESSEAIVNIPNLANHLHYIKACLDDHLLNNTSPEPLYQRSWIYLFWKHLNSKNYAEAKKLLQIDLPIDKTHKKIWLHLFQNEWDQCKALFETLSSERLYNENSPLFFLYGCWLGATEGEKRALQHFNTTVDISYPRTRTLAPHFLMGKIQSPRWSQNAFMWEKRKLYQQLILYYHCLQNKDQEIKYRELEKTQYCEL